MICFCFCGFIFEHRASVSLLLSTALNPPILILSYLLDNHFPSNSFTFYSTSLYKVVLFMPYMHRCFIFISKECQKKKNLFLTSCLWNRLSESLCWKEMSLQIISFCRQIHIFHNDFLLCNLSSSFGT